MSQPPTEGAHPRPCCDPVHSFFFSCSSCSCPIRPSAPLPAFVFFPVPSFSHSHLICFVFVQHRSHVIETPAPGDKESCAAFSLFSFHHLDLLSNEEVFSEYYWVMVGFHSLAPSRSRHGAGNQLCQWSRCPEVSLLLYLLLTLLSL